MEQLKPVHSMDEIETYKTMPDLVLDWAYLKPTGLAFTFLDANGREESHLTYGSLLQKSLRIAHLLIHQGLRGSHVALITPPGIDFILGFFGALLAGAIPIPLNLPKRGRWDEKVAASLRGADVKAICCTMACHDTIRNALVDHTALALLCIDQDLYILKPPGAFITQAHTVDLAFMQFTSGSVASPKCIMISHAQCLACLEMLASASHLTAQSTLVCWVPHYHDLGLISHILHSVYVGAHCVLLSPQTFIMKPIEWFRAITTYRAQFTGAPNFAFDHCVKRIREEELVGIDLSSLTAAINAAEPVRADTLVAFSERFALVGFQYSMFITAYGMAETVIYISSGTQGAGTPTKLLDCKALYEQQRAVPAQHLVHSHRYVSCGTGAAQQTLRIVDPQTLTLLEPNRVGEIWVAGPQVMMGYYNDPDATAATVGRLPDDNRRYLRTGDLGFIDDLGELYITGRLKELIIKHGVNYYPHEIEAVVEAAHPAIRPAGSAAFGILRNASEEIVLFTEITGSACKRLQNDPSYQHKLVTQLCARVGEVFEIVINDILFLKPGQLPKTSSGKTQRGQCKQQWLTGQVQAVYHWSRPADPPTLAQPQGKPMTTLEKTLHRLMTMGPEHLKVFSIISQLMSQRYQVDVADVDLDHSIFFYGIDSLNIIDIHTELEKQLGKPIATEAFFNSNSLIGMINDIVVSIPSRSDRSGADDHDTDHTLQDEIEALLNYLEADLAAHLSESAVHPPALSVHWPAAGRMLLTGGSGFVGVYLLKELLDSTAHHIVCLVRAHSEAHGLQRIRDQAHKFNVQLPAGYESRLSILAGDISKHRFGLNDDVFESLAQTIDGVVHCAAVDNFYLPYSILKKTNVQGTVEVIQFALHGTLKPIFHVSSCAAALIDPDQTIQQTQGLVNGYAQTKYVSEQLIRRLAQQGFPAFDYRLGYLYSLRVNTLSPDSSFKAVCAAVAQAYAAAEESILVEADAFENFLQAVPEMQCLPDIDCDFDLASVEYCTKALVDTLANGLPAVSSYTFYNPVPLKWKDVIAYYQRTNKHIQVLPLPAFVDAYERFIQGTDNNALKLLKSVVSQALEQQLNTMFRGVDTDIATHHLHWAPPCNDAFTQFYIDAVIND